MRRLIASFIGAKAATSAIEFAMLVPLLLVMIAGTVEFGRAFQVYNTTNRLATQYAIAWSDCSDIPVGSCNAELTSFGSGNLSANLVPQLQASALSMRMFQITMVGTNATVTYAFPAGSTLTAAETSAAQGVLTNGQSGVVVTATYAHTLQYFSALMSPFLASAFTVSFTATQLKA
jgi:Flp pilus assembly protein TadG